MARQRIMQRFAKWHIWLGWLVGVPILMWTVTGLVMVARPIEEVRGDHLRAQPHLLREFGRDITLPQVAEFDVIAGARLVQQADGPVWIVDTEAGGTYRYSARTGALIPPVIREEAVAIAERAYAGEGTLQTLNFFGPEDEPQELRLGATGWQASFDDGTNIYIDNATGQVMAIRSSWWRVFDFMWGLHIMDLETREDTSHPVLIIFAALGVIGSLLGCILMFRRRKARVKAG